MKRSLLFLILLISSISWAQNKNWQCIDSKGNLLFEVKAKSVYEFNEGMARAKIAYVENNKWKSAYGFIDETGKVAIAPKYSKIKGKGFVNGRAWVKKIGSDYWTLIDKTGQEIPTKNYKKVGYLHEINQDLICVYEGDYLGFINKDGKEVIPCKYLGGTSFHLDLACVTTESSSGYGFINRSGEVVIPLKFKQAGIATFMDNGMCRATVGGKTVLINTKGEVVFKTDKGNIQGVSNEWVRVFTKSDRTGWGFLNMENEWMIQAQYEDLSHFDDNGRAIAQKNGLSGIISTKNEVLLPFKYSDVYNDPKEDGYIMAAYPTDQPQSLMNTPKDYFNENLEAVDVTGIKYIYSAKGGPLMPYKDANGKLGYLDRSFNKVIAAQYKKAGPCVEGKAWVLRP